MARTKKPAPRVRSRASNGVLAGERDSQKFISRRTILQQPGTVEVFDGRLHTGSLVPRGNGWLAYAASGKFLGSFGSDRLAARAVYEAQRPRGAS